MARIRSIKPEFWTSDQVVECSTNTRLLFIGLWNFCDDHGRHPLSPKRIKALIFPADDFAIEEISEMLIQLDDNGLIECYVYDGKYYLHVTGWSHQKIDRRQPAKYPDPYDAEIVSIRTALDENSTNAHRTLASDRIGREGKGEDISYQGEVSYQNRDGNEETPIIRRVK